MAIDLNSYDPLAAFDQRMDAFYGGPPRKPRQLTPAADDPDPNDESLLEELANKGMSGLQYIGETLDKTFLARTVRGLLGGEGLAAFAHAIPFSDTLGLTDDRGLFGSNLLASKQDVPSGRGLLEQAGIIDKKTEPGLDLGDIAGMATEIALDPALGLSLGSHALSASGKLAKVAGLLPDAVYKGAELERGANVGRMTTTLADLASASPEARQSLEQATKLPFYQSPLSEFAHEPISPASARVSQLASTNEPLGSLATWWGMPIGTGKTGIDIARRLDTATDALRSSLPGRLVTGLFGPNAKNTLNRESQLAAKDVSATEEAGRAGAMDEMLQARKAVAAVGMDPDVFERAMNQHLENQGITDFGQPAGIRLAPAEQMELASTGGFSPAERAQLKTMMSDEAINKLEAEQAAPGAAAAMPTYVPGGNQFLQATKVLDLRGIDSIDKGSIKNILTQLGVSKELLPQAVDQMVSRLMPVGVKSLPGEALQSPGIMNELVNAAKGANMDAIRWGPEGAEKYAVLNPTKLIQGGDLEAAAAAKGIPPEQYQKFNAVMEQLKQGVNSDWQEMKAQGNAPGYLHDPLIDYGGPRQVNVDTKATGMWNKLFPTKMAAQIERVGGLTGIPGGTDAINELTKAMYNNPVTEELSSELVGKNAYYQGRDAAARIQSKLGVDSAKANELAKALAALPDEAVGKPLFTNRLDAIQNYRLQAASVKAGNTGFLQFMANYAHEAQPGEVPLEKVLESAGFNKGVALDNIAKLRPDGNVEGLTVPANLARDATRMIRGFSSPETIKPLLQAFDVITRAFKVGVTTPWPATDVRYFGTGVWNGWVAHAGDPRFTGPRGIWQPLKDAYDFLGGRAVAGAEDIPALRGMSAEEANQALREQAYVHQVQGGFSRNINPAGPVSRNPLAELPGVTPLSLSSVASQYKMSGVKDFIPSLIRGGAAAGDLAEGVPRVGAWLGYLRQGMSFENAASRVKEVLGDFTKSTAFEKSVAKRVVPFYAWSRQLLPIVFEDMLTSPGGRTAQAIRAEGDLKQQTGFLPDYLKSGLAIPLGAEASGQQKFLSTTGLPFELIDDLYKPGNTLLKTIQNTGEAALGQTNPLIKAPLETAVGKQFYTGRDLADLKGPFGELNPPVLLDQLLMNSPAARVFSSAAKLGDSRKSVGEKALDLLSGVRTADVDLSRARDTAAADAIKDLLRNEPGIRTGQPDISIDKQTLAEMSPEDAQLFDLYKGIQKRAQNRAKLRKAQQAQLVPQ